MKSVMLAVLGLAMMGQICSIGAAEISIRPELEGVVGFLRPYWGEKAEAGVQALADKKIQFLAEPGFSTLIRQAGADPQVVQGVTASVKTEAGSEVRSFVRAAGNPLLVAIAVAHEQSHLESSSSRRGHEEFKEECRARMTAPKLLEANFGLGWMETLKKGLSKASEVRLLPDGRKFFYPVAPAVLVLRIALREQGIDIAANDVELQYIVLAIVNSSSQVEGILRATSEEHARLASR